MHILALQYSKKCNHLKSIQLLTEELVMCLTLKDVNPLEYA